MPPPHSNPITDPPWQYTDPNGNPTPYYMPIELTRPQDYHRWSHIISHSQPHYMFQPPKVTVKAPEPSQGVDEDEEGERAAEMEVKKEKKPVAEVY